MTAHFRPAPAIARGPTLLTMTSGVPPTLALAALLASATGCESVRHDFLPLEAGASWTYRVTSGSKRVGSDSIRVTSELPPRAGMDGGGAERRFRVDEPGGSALWSKEGGTVVRATLRETTTVILHPPFVGSGWTDEVSGRFVFCRIESRGAVEVPLGWYFDCVVVRREAEDRSSIITQWFAADVGIVKWRLERPGRADVEWTLEAYDPGGD